MRYGDGTVQTKLNLLKLIIHWRRKITFLLKVMLTMTVMVVGFQNCSNTGMQAATAGNSLIQSVTSCSFGSQTLISGATATGYSASSVASGGSCSSVQETVTCNNGILSPANASATCNVSTGSGSGTSPIVTAYYVSPTGSDKNNGLSTTTAFATLGAAQLAMQKSSNIKTTYILAGTYNLTPLGSKDPNGQPAVALDLVPQDSGETWSYYPPDGVNQAVLNGQNKVDGIVVLEAGANNISIIGLKITNPISIAIWTAGQVDSFTLKWCDIGNNNSNDGNFGGWPPLIGITGTKTQILYNYIHDALSMGIEVTAYRETASDKSSINGSLISGNVLLRTVQSISDGGAIYINMHVAQNSSSDPTDTITVTNNYVAQYGGTNTWGAHGIYLDDNTSNATVTGNIVGPPTAGTGTGSGSLYGTNAITAFIDNSGGNNIISGNLVDLGTSGTVGILALVYDTEDSAVPMKGDTFTGNIVLSNFKGALTAWNTNASACVYVESTSDPQGYSYTVKNNLYWNYASGGSVFSNGQAPETGAATPGDTAPITNINPFSGSTYSSIIGANYSLAINSAANFRPFVGGWGFPGFSFASASTPSY
jgi:hypothetical protein